MSDAARCTGRLRLRLPATSANLGPGFDAAAVALDFYLARSRPSRRRVLDCMRRDVDADRCGRLEDNLILEIYRETPRRERQTDCAAGDSDGERYSAGHGLRIVGCGTAGGDRAGCPFWRAWVDRRADPRGGVGTGRASRQRGGMLAGRICERRHAGKAGARGPSGASGKVERDRGAACRTAGHQQGARGAAASYSRDDVVANLQSVSLLGLAFAQARGDLLRVAMNDRIHQPYRAAICPMLPRFLPLAGQAGHPGSGVERRRTGGAGYRGKRRPRRECGCVDQAGSERHARTEAGGLPV